MATLPTKEQFLRDPRARELRQICLDIADAADRILHDPNVNKQTEYARLEHKNGRLIALGISADMNTELNQSAYEDPVTMAEYMAGQWLSELGEQFSSEKSILPIVQEHSEENIGNAHIIDTKNIHPKVFNFMVTLTFVNVTRRFLDAEKNYEEM